MTRTVDPAPNLPGWLVRYPRTRPIQIAPTGPFELLPDVYEPLWSDHMRRNWPEERMTFAGIS